VSDWNFGDEGERGLQRGAAPVDDDDGSGFWAPGATRPRKILASVLILLAATFVAWHAYELVLGFFRALG